MNDDPFIAFTRWYGEAQKDCLVNPDAVALASATSAAKPSVRIVSFRGIREGGFSFFTNYESRKGRHFAENPVGAILFYWPRLGRQVRIEGHVKPLSEAESDSYFADRPFKSQITALISRQSRRMDNEDEFVSQLRDAEDAHDGQPVSRPAAWGGFTLLPSRFEFWTHGEHRRHRRVVYEKTETDWRISMLYP